MKRIVFGQSVNEPADLKWTPAICKQFLALPICSDFKLSMTSLWPSLTKSSRAEFLAVVSADAKEQFLKLAFHHAALAHPELKAWPEPTLDDLLDECYLGAAPLWNIRYLVNGRRLVLAGSSQEKQWLSFLEFEAKYGLSVDCHLKSVGRKMVSDILKASRWANRDPKIFEVSYANRRKAGHKTIAAFELDQVMSYLDRNKQKLLTVESFPAVFKGGAYVKGECHATHAP